MTRQRKFPMWLFQVRAGGSVCATSRVSKMEAASPRHKAASQGGMTSLGVPHRAEPGIFPAVDIRHVCSFKSKTTVNKNTMRWWDNQKNASLTRH